MKLLVSYIRQRWRGILIFFLFCGVFCGTFALYRLPVAAVAYPMFLCMVLGLIFAAADFLRVSELHRRLEEIRELPAAMISDLPQADSVEDRDYQAIIRALQAEVMELATQTSARYQDMMEYYTIWVHQIKTPIASMQLSLQYEDTPLSRKLSSDLLRIEQYVEMVLAFLRLDSASTDYVFREHSLDEIVKQAVARFAPEFISRRIRLEYEPAAETVVTDEKWLAFVIEQILSNALKYTNEGTIRIRMEQPKTLCIEDTGIGIAPEDLPRVFEKGYTGYNGRWDKKASGLGLYLCRRICDSLGAGISIASELDKGTAVRIDLQQYELKKE